MIWLSFVNKRLTSTVMAYAINKATFLSPYWQRLTNWHLAVLNYFLVFSKKSTVFFLFCSMIYCLVSLKGIAPSLALICRDLFKAYMICLFFSFSLPHYHVCNSQFIKQNGIITSEPVGRRALSWPFRHVKVRQRIWLTIRSVFSASSRTSSILSVNK